MVQSTRAVAVLSNVSSPSDTAEQEPTGSIVNFYLVQGKLLEATTAALADIAQRESELVLKVLKVTDVKDDRVLDGLVSAFITSTKPLTERVEVFRFLNVKLDEHANDVALHDQDIGTPKLTSFLEKERSRLETALSLISRFECIQKEAQQLKSSEENAETVQSMREEIKSLAMKVTELTQEKNE